jgi:hypothetical protein
MIRVIAGNGYICDIGGLLQRLDLAMLFGLRLEQLTGMERMMGAL